MTDLEELSDSSTSSGDENVEEDPIVVTENAGAIFRIFQAALPLHVSESFLPTKGSISKGEVKQLLVQVPGTV